MRAAGRTESGKNDLEYLKQLIVQRAAALLRLILRIKHLLPKGPVAEVAARTSVNRTR
jgi:hypothetical protein